MHTDLISPLNWDTEQLGIPTGKVTASSLSLEDLQHALAKARQKDIKLLYWVIDQHEKESINAAKKLNGILTDHKVTYVMNLIKVNKSNAIEVYTDKTPSEDLIYLAYESGKYSRFRADPNLTEQQFQHVYKTWMINSVNHSIAQDVLVIREKDKLLGMVTVGDKNNRGDIGLLAVSEDARGKGTGIQLVQGAQHYFYEKNYNQSQVVTQQINIPASRLYEKCGYQVEKIEYFFHFWI